MVGYKRLLSAMSSRGVKDNKVNKSPNNSYPIDSNNEITPEAVVSSSLQMVYKRERPEHVATGLGEQHYSTSAPPSSTSDTSAIPSSTSSATHATTLKKPYRFDSVKQKTIDPYTPPSTADATMVESEATRAFSMLPSSKPTIGSLTPPATVRSESSMSANERVEAVAKTSMNIHAADIAHTTINAQSSVTNTTDFTTSVDVQSDASEEVDNNLGAHNAELETALAGMRAAEKLLSQRHAAIKPQANTGKRMKPLDIINKMANQRASSAPVHVPSNVSAFVQPKAQSTTANEAIQALQRRQAMKDLVFFAANGCPSNVAIIEQINAHLRLQQRHSAGEIPDVTFNVHGVSILASQMPLGSVERLWIVRYNAMINNVKLVERRLLNEEDHELIVAQLLPHERAHILKPEYFEVYMDSLGEEGIFTRAEAKTIANIGVTLEEFDKGAHYIHTPGSKYKDRNANAVSIFDIPRPPMRTISSNTTRYTEPETQQDLYPYLRILVEAAVYKQKFWKGYFFPNARSKLNEFFQAYQLTQEGWLLPPNLTDYKRLWSDRETRLLQRGQYVCNLLAQYEASQITDYGIIRAIRATFVGIPAQPSWCAEDLEKFLYHRIIDSGLAISKIPEVLLLHPDNDKFVASPPARHHVREALEVRMRVFEAEEAARLKEIHQSQSTFDEAKKKGMSRWARVKAGWKRRFGKKAAVTPFNPFDPLH
ncbi:hypothetical protein PTMSG1_04960 [Pyrenophora teres f. maculata]|nr:hypothetical protein PTMSG1_04960 [Pyrenophora teres f. maculata]